MEHMYKILHGLDIPPSKRVVKNRPDSGHPHPYPSPTPEFMVKQDLNFPLNFKQNKKCFQNSRARRKSLHHASRKRRTLHLVADKKGLSQLLSSVREIKLIL
ncbi:hypothetical protein MXB_1509 [Myxobolus squamalis]|nr:hypothetical protein MXB_1509 [Myxobolus squamalis]